MFISKICSGTLIFLLICFSSISDVRGQGSPVATAKTVETSDGYLENGPYQVIKVDLNSQSMMGILPFDEPFFILGEVDTTLLSVSCWYIVDPTSTFVNTTPTDLSTWKPLKLWQQKMEGKPYVFKVPMLEPNTNYAFYFKFNKRPNESDTKQILAYTKSILTPIINSTAKKQGGENEFTVEQREAILAQITDKTNNFLNKKGLALDLQGISDDDLKKNLEAIKTISLAFEDSRDYTRNLNNGHAAFKAMKGNLEKALNNYLATGSTTAKLTNELNTVLTELNALGKFPADEDALDKDKRAAFLGKLNSILMNATKISAPKNKAIVTERQFIIDNASKMIADFKSYVASLTDAEAITSEQNATMLTTFADLIIANAVISGSSMGDFKTRAKTYISADLGVAVLPGISKVAPYLGTNIYFRPINKERPLRWSDNDQFGRRFSLLIGLTIGSLAKPNQREDLLANSFNLITGAGFRVWDGLRINGGALWYQSTNSNPLISKSTIRATPFVSLSFDIDIKTIFNNLFTPEHLTNSIF